MAIVYPIGGGGNLTGSDDCTATKAEVLKGYYAITEDSDDEAVQGTLELTGNAEDRYVYSGKTYYSNDAKVKHTGTFRVDSVVNFNKPSVNGATVVFTWQNPTTSPYGGVIIRVKEGGYPTSVSDGIEAYRGTGSNKEHGQLSNTTWYAPKNNVTYYARIWVYCNTSEGMIYSSSYKEQTFAISRLQGQQVIKSSGTFTVPHGVNEIQVFVVGGGGGGASSGGSSGAFGGGSGRVATGTFNVIPNQKIPCTIGAGGNGGRWGNNGGKGGTTTFGSFISALGGNVGTDNGLHQGYGGSGGGSGGTSRDYSQGARGGSNGSGGYGSNNRELNNSQKVTTRAFGESQGTLYAGGGGGGGSSYGGSNSGGGGGSGGGGYGGDGDSKSYGGTGGGNGTANTGSGGGGAGSNAEVNSQGGGVGGSGLIIVRWS